MSSERRPEDERKGVEPGTDSTELKVSSTKEVPLLRAPLDKNEVPVPGNDDGDFGQSELQKEKDMEDQIRRKTKTWMGKGSPSSSNTEASRDLTQNEVSANVDLNVAKPTETSDSPSVSPTYSLTDFDASAIRTPNCTLPNLLNVQNSYGYDSKRPYNIHALDSDTLVYITGNYLHFFSLKKRQLVKLQRAASGYGIGHLVVHPEEKFFAVAEKGSNPLIVVYTWPEGKVSRVLRGGTERGYAFVDFNPEGNLLCSQGLEPDYLLTIWDWRKERIVLHYKAFSQDVFRASFSASYPGHLTTCGIGHIRFWKMARTFTGLKLQGQIGRFGKTEISDVLGFIGLSDGKIISTSEWGNMLVWEGGLIVVEVVAKELETCHEGEMTNILLLETGEILTVGRDGFVKLWESELISVADTVVDDTGKYGMTPILEFKLATYISPVSVIKDAGDEESSYFIQDGFGKLWNFKLGEASRSNEYQPEIVFDLIGGSMSAIATSTVYTLLAIGNTEGHLWLVEYTSKEPLIKAKYDVGITKILWLPQMYDSEGLTFLCSFDDGVVRVFRIHHGSSQAGSEGNSAETEGEPSFKLGVLQIFKLHQGSVHVMLLDEEHGILYTCGADRKIFTLKIGKNGNNVNLTPLGFVTAPFPVIALDLHPFKDYRMVIASRQGRVAECRRPDWESHDRSKTYDMGKLHGRKWQYMSVKSNKRREERRESRVKQLEAELEELREKLSEKRTGGAFVDEEMEVSRLKEKYRKQQIEDDETPLYFPDQCPIYSIYYRINKSFLEPKPSRHFFLHVGGYDAGYIYECKCTRAEAGGFHAVPATPPFTDDVPVRCFIHSEDNEYLIFGMADGTLRVMGRTKESSEINSDEAKAEAERRLSLLYGDDGDDEEEDDFDDTNMMLMNNQANQPETLQKRTIRSFPVSVFPYNLKEFVSIPVHDPNRGAVTDLAWSHDRNLLFSCAEDGSVFSSRWDPTGKNAAVEDRQIMPGHDVSVADIPPEPENLESLTLEEQVQKAERDKLFTVSEKKKEGTRKRIESLKAKFRYLKQKNLEISKDFRLPRSAFEIDPMIRESKRDRLAQEVEQVYRRYEWDSEKSLLEVDRLEKVFLSEVETHHMIVKDLLHEAQVHTFRSRILTPDFDKVMEENAEKLKTENSEQQDQMLVVKEPTFAKVENVRRIYAKDLIGDYQGKKYDMKTLQQIRQLEQRLAKRYEREVKWAELMAMKIPNSFLYPEDVANVNLAQQTLGAYRLKSDESNLGGRMSIAQRRQQIINLKLEIHGRISEFNSSVVYLRDEKLSLLQECRELEHQLSLIQRLLPSELHKPIPKVKDLESCEKPEVFFRISVKDVSSRVVAKISDLQASEKGAAQEQKRYSIPQVWKNVRQSTPLSADPKAVTELEKESLATLKARKAFFKPTSELGKAKLEKALRERCFEQDQLLSKLTNMIDYFRSRVEGLRNERFELQIDVLLMSMRLITLMHELDIVKEFTGEEEAVVSRYENQKKNTDMVQQRLDRVDRRLSKAKNELEHVKNNLVSLNKEVASIIGEKQRFSEFLWKVFRKKLRVENADEDEDEDMVQAGSIASSSDSGDSTSVDSTSDLFRLPKVKFNIDSCPPQLDRLVYERVCELRTKKYQYELETEAQKRVVAKIERDHDGVKEVFSKYNEKLGWIKKELIVLQKKRQAKINRLHALVILNADQIRCLPEDDEEDQEPLSRLSGVKLNIVEQIRNNFPDLADVIVFPKDGLMSLESRIDGVKDETLKEQEKFELGKTMLQRLREEVAKMLTEIGSLDEKYQKEMIGKFGKIVDLDDICAAVINLEILDELIKLEKRRNWHHRERKKISNEIDKTRDRLTVLTRENTENNNLLAILLERQRELEYLMWKRAAQRWPEWTQQIAITGSGDGGDLSRQIMDKDSDLISNEEALEEMFHLEDIVTRQECRIFILRQTIEVCKRKCGLPPLIPLKSVKDDIASKFMTLNEVYALRNKKNADVETLYVSDTADKLHLSTSSVPTGEGAKGLVAGDNEKPAWGIPEHGTFGASSGPYFGGQMVLDLMEDEEEDVKIVIDDVDEDAKSQRPPSAATVDEEESNGLEDNDESAGFVGVDDAEIVQTTAQLMDE